MTCIESKDCLEGFICLQSQCYPKFDRNGRLKHYDYQSPCTTSTDCIKEFTCLDSRCQCSDQKFWVKF